VKSDKGTITPLGTNMANTSLHRWGIPPTREGSPSAVTLVYPRIASTDLDDLTLQRRFYIDSITCGSYVALEFLSFYRRQQMLPAYRTEGVDVLGLLHL
jgi:hypothetical protein